MAQAGFTPISLYFSSTAAAVPTAGNLANGELGLNIADMKLYAKNSSGVVTLLASSGGASGTVSTVSVVSANGLAGTVANATTTPAITLSTTITGVLKGNGTAISAAVSGTDYAPATSGTSILYGNGAGGFNNVTIGTGVSFAGGTLSATGTGGTVTSVGVSGGTTGLTTSGSPITTSGTITLAGTLAVANGGTGQTTATAAFDALAPSQGGNSGKYLTTNGTTTSWGTVDALPSQTGNAGKYLSTNGTVASWENTGASAGGVIWENSLIVSTNYTLTTAKNGFSVGPITINSGVTVTVPSGQRWVIL